MRQRVYISGPLTSSGNVLDNLARAMDATRALIARRVRPVLSAPHLSRRSWRGVSARSMDGD